MSVKKEGAQASQLEKQIGPENFPPNEHYFGLVNFKPTLQFGNTCYCNSVLQALYHCRAFREKVLAHRSRSPKTENLLTTLSDLFHCIYTQKRRVGTLAPKKFIQRLRKDNELFDNYTQQDAHEFLNYLLNTIADILQAEKTNPPPPTKSKKGGGGGLLNGSGPSKASTAASNKNSSDTPASENNQKSEHSTWVHEIFEGTLTNETRCLNCETTSSKDENFIDLSVDIEPNTSISQCLRGFSMLETLSRECKYYCEVCCSKQEAQKRMLVKKLPNLLALHLKRFKYQEQYNRHTKLSYRVVFPMELRLPNLSEDAINPNRMYTLSAIVVHCGIGPNRGHYICIVKSGGYWLVFDDDIVDKIDPSSFENFYGLSTEFQKNNMESGYILFYESIE